MGLTSAEAINLDDVTAFLMAERAKVLSDAEWRHRMRGFGFRLTRTDCGVEVARLPKGDVLGTVEI